MKPYKGSIKDWYVFYPSPQWKPQELGYVIKGTFVDHEDFAGEQGGTSWVVEHDEGSGEIETLNSRYNLIGDPIRKPQRYEGE